MYPPPSSPPHVSCCLMSYTLPPDVLFALNVNKISNKVICAQIPDEKFPVLLQYLEGLRGGARDITVQKAMVLVEESGQAPQDQAVQQRAHRAREVIQLLS